jgi:uncharacterized protein YrrD
MLQNIKGFYGNTLAASDGDIGCVKDFYFDDKTWVVRYLVADTGSWLSGRLVLVSPHAFGRYDRDGKTLHVGLTRKQIENSPPIDSHKPVSRQYEIDYYRYYGWPAYWDGSALWGRGSLPVLMPPSADEVETDLRYHHRKDKHLQSTCAIAGYQIQTVDGTIGHVSDLMVDDKSWAIRDLSVETGHWYRGKEIFISPGKIDRISYEDSKVFVNLTKADIQGTRDNELAKACAGSRKADNLPD